MAVESSSQQEAEQAIGQPRRGRRHAFYVACVLLLLIGLCETWFEAVAHSRYRVIGVVDPETGYRIEYTVSSRFRKSVGSKQDLDALGNTFMFSPKPPPRALQWFYNRILHRATPPSNRGYYRDEQGTINQLCFKNAVSAGLTINQQGYAEITDTRYGLVDMLMEHRIVSDCPATWYAYTAMSAGIVRTRQYILFIKPRDQVVTFEFEATDDLFNPTGVDVEMRMIRDSIRVTKMK